MEVKYQADIIMQGHLCAGGSQLPHLIQEPISKSTKHSRAWQDSRERVYGCIRSMHAKKMKDLHAPPDKTICL